MAWLETYHLIQLVIFIFLVGVVLAIFIDNVRLRRRVHVDFEQYRTQVHKALEKAIAADTQEVTALALVQNITAQAEVNVLCELVGGADSLTVLSGIEIKDLKNTFCKAERHIRKVAIAKGVLPAHDLGKWSSEEPLTTKENGLGGLVVD